MNNKRIKLSYRQKLGYSVAIGAILTSAPMNQVTAEETVPSSQEDSPVDTQEASDSTKVELAPTDLIEDIFTTYQILTTYDETLEKEELVEAQLGDLITHVEQLLEDGGTEKAVEIITLLLTLQSLPEETEALLVELKNNIENASTYEEADPEESAEKLEDADSNEVKEDNKEKATKEEIPEDTSEDTPEVIIEEVDEPLQEAETSSETEEKMDSQEEAKDAEWYASESSSARYASDSWMIAQEGYALYPDSDLLSQALNQSAQRMMTIGRNNHSRGQFTSAIVYYNEVANHSGVSAHLKGEALNYIRFASINEQVQTPENLAAASKSARYASEAWELALYGVELYPKDSLTLSALEQAALRMLTIGRNSYSAGNYSRAVDYYSQVANTPGVPQTVVSQAENLMREAEDTAAHKAADNLYFNSVTARFASDAWQYALEGLDEFPGDTRFLDALNQAANRMLTIGTSSHRSGDFNRAVDYYDELLSVPEVPAAIRNQANVQKSQAESGQKLLSANDFYQKATTARYASDAWAAAKDGLHYFPNDRRFIDALAQAAERMMTLGMNSHRSGNFARATEYYDELISTTLTPAALINQAKVFKGQAERNVRFRTADDYVKEATDARFASDAWAAANEGLLVYPNNQNLIKALDQAAGRMLTIGRNNHNSKNYSSASDYYLLVMNQPSVSEANRDLARVLNGFASQNQAVKSASAYAREINSASFASVAWEKAVEANSVHSSNNIIKEALINAANRQIQLGRQYERGGNPSRARPYFDRVANHSALPASLRQLAASYSRLTQANYRPIIFIDPGHGGKDSGAHFGGVKESTLNLSTSKFLQAELQSRGYQVIMSRETDVYLTMEERSTMANSMDYDILLSIHYNSMGGRGTARGIETFIHHTVPSGFGQERDHSKYLTDNPRIEDSLRMANLTHGELIRQTGLFERNVKANNFHMVREPYLPAVLYELGFMDNPAELAHVSRVSFHRQAAKAIADGVDAYFRK